MMLAIYKESGVVRGLYRGLSTNYIRGIPNSAVTFGAYEAIKRVTRGLKGTNSLIQGILKQEKCVSEIIKKNIFPDHFLYILFFHYLFSFFFPVSIFLDTVLEKGNN